MQAVFQANLDSILRLASSFFKHIWTAFWDLQAVFQSNVNSIFQANLDSILRLASSFSGESGQHFETCKQFFQAYLDSILRLESGFSSKSGQHFETCKQFFNQMWTAFFRLIWTAFWDLQAVFQANLDRILRLASSFSIKSGQHFSG